MIAVYKVRDVGGLIRVVMVKMEKSELIQHILTRDEAISYMRVTMY